MEHGKRGDFSWDFCQQLDACFWVENRLEYSVIYVLLGWRGLAYLTVDSFIYLNNGVHA